jgi:outer membrane protein assembly factor BamB
MLRVAPRELRLPESFFLLSSVAAAMRFIPPSIVACVAASLVTATCPAGEQVCGTVADAFVAEELGLRREWIVQVPFNTSATRLEQVTVADGIVIAAAGDGSLHGIAAPIASAADAAASLGQPAPGTLLWSYFPSRGDGSQRPPAVGSGIVVIGGDFEAIAIDLLSGRTLWRQPLPSPAVAAAAISGDWVYVPLEGGRLMRLAVNPYQLPAVETVVEKKQVKKDAESTSAESGYGLSVSRASGEKVRPLMLSTHGSLVLPPLPLQDGVIWCTTNGLLTSLTPAQPEWVREEFSLGRPPAGRPLIVSTDSGTAIFIASNTGPAASDVVRIDLLPTGLVFAWREPLDDAVAGGATRSGDTILVPLATGGMTALAAVDGRRLWTHPRQVQLLTVTAGRLWCIDDMGRLATLDPADGRRLQQFCLAPFRVPVVNDLTNRLILASPGGIIASLAPRGDQ